MHKSVKFLTGLSLAFSMIACQSEAPLTIPDESSKALEKGLDTTAPIIYEQQTPGGSTPGGTTPGGSTPGGTTPGGTTPGGTTTGGTTLPVVDPLPNGGKHKNSDGSITIVAPKFTYQGVDQRVLATVNASYRTSVSAYSPKGVCALFGLPNYISVAVSATNATDGVELNQNGTFKTLFNVNAMNPHVYVEWVICAATTISPDFLTQANRLTNTDGSVSIMEPRIKFNGKEEKVLTTVNANYRTSASSYSSLGLCKLHGFTTFVTHQFSATNATDGVELQTTGFFKTYFNGSATNPHVYIHSVTCRN